MIRYRQHKPDGTVVQADWLTNFPTRQAGSPSLYHMAKSRWEIENQGFNDAKNRYGTEHICHHQANRVLLNWLITLLPWSSSASTASAICTAGGIPSARPNTCAACSG